MATKEVAVKKRAQIDQATQLMLIAVGAASVVFGCAIVLSVYFVKWIIFNTKVIGEKDKSIQTFRLVQGNVETLAGNVNTLAKNENLEVMARTRENRCTTFEGALVDTTGNIEMARICSALRVIPDALPSVNNPYAVYASLNKLFLETKDDNGQSVQPVAISPGNGSAKGLNLGEGLNGIPAALIIESSAGTSRAVLDTIERSIRNYDVQSVVIAWRSTDRENQNRDLIELRGNAMAYFSDAIDATTLLKSKTVYADDSKNKTEKKR